MKPKSALFVSAVLTAFVLAILGGVVSTLNTSTSTEVAINPTQQEVLPTDIPTQAQPTAITVAQVSPEQAASIAAQFMNKTDVYSVETFALNGVNVFKVVFSAGEIVYVGLDGVVISTEVLQPTVVYVEPTLAPQQNNGGNGGSGDDDHDEDEHEDEKDEDEHEDEDEND